MAEFVYEPLPDPEAYLARMNYTGSRERNRETLNALVYAHQCSIPFENLSCCDYGEPVVLDIPSLYDKIVNRRRGGYCFELNGIFAALLWALGFDAYSTMCRLARSDELRPVMHRGVVVRLDGKRYFCDVGYGGPMAPFAIELSPERHTFYGETFWIDESADGWWRVSRRRGAGHPIGEDGSAEPEDVVVAFFTLSAFLDQDFAPLSYQCSAIPTSGFVTRRWANLRTADGYLSLINEELTEVHNGVKTVTQLDDVPAVLRERFGLEKR